MGMQSNLLNAAGSVANAVEGIKNYKEKKEQEAIKMEWHNKIDARRQQAWAEHDAAIINRTQEAQEELETQLQDEAKEKKLTQEQATAEHDKVLAAIKADAEQRIAKGAAPAMAQLHALNRVVNNNRASVKARQAAKAERKKKEKATLELELKQSKIRKNNAVAADIESKTAARNARMQKNAQNGPSETPKEEPKQNTSPVLNEEPKQDVLATVPLQEQHAAQQLTGDNTTAAATRTDEKMKAEEDKQEVLAAAKEEATVQNIGEAKRQEEEQKKAEEAKIEEEKQNTINVEPTAEEVSEEESKEEEKPEESNKSFNAKEMAEVARNKAKEIYGSHGEQVPKELLDAINTIDIINPNKEDFINYVCHGDTIPQDAEDKKYKRNLVNAGKIINTMPTGAKNRFATTEQLETKYQDLSAKLEKDGKLNEADQARYDKLNEIKKLQENPAWKNYYGPHNYVKEAERDNKNKRATLEYLAKNNARFSEISAYGYIDEILNIRNKRKEMEEMTPDQRELAELLHFSVTPENNIDKNIENSAWYAIGQYTDKILPPANTVGLNKDLTSDPDVLNKTFYEEGGPLDFLLNAPDEVYEDTSKKLMDNTDLNRNPNVYSNAITRFENEKKRIAQNIGNSMPQKKLIEKESAMARKFSEQSYNYVRDELVKKFGIGSVESGLKPMKDTNSDEFYAEKDRIEKSPEYLKMQEELHTHVNKENELRTQFDKELSNEVAKNNAYRVAEYFIRHLKARQKLNAEYKAEQTANKDKKNKSERLNNKEGEE